MKPNYFPLSLTFLVSFIADRIHSASAVPAPQAFAAETSLAIAPQPTGVASDATQHEYSLPPLSVVFYAVTRDPTDPPAAFETGAGEQLAIIPDSPVYPPSTDAAAGVIGALPLTTSTTREQTSTSRLVSSVAHSTSTTNSVSPAPASTVAPVPVPKILDDDDDGNHDNSTKGQKKLSVFSRMAIAFGALASLSLLIFLLLDPRVSRGCRRERVNSRGLGKRPISSWFPFPSSSSPPSVSKVSRKAVSNSSHRNLDLLETSERSGGSLSIYPYPRSKFSVSSSEYSQMSAASTADTMLAENTRANASTSVPPVRPPRPRTADSPGVMPMFFGPEEPNYMEPQLDGGGSVNTLDTAKDESPLLPPNKFFTLASPSLSSTSTLKPEIRINNAPHSIDAGSQASREEIRHMRMQSAPGLIGGAFDEGYPPLHIDPVARRVLMHRRSRSTSGWAYHRREEGGGSSSDSENSTYNGVFGQAL